MKRHFIFIALILSLLSLNACANKPHAKQNVATASGKQDFLTTGRGLSNGAVDLYQPGTDFLPTEQFPNAGRGTNVSSIPGNSNIMVNDPSVTIYSLDTMPSQEVQAAPLPPLQPPANVRGNYPSPFDAKGNPTK